MLPLTEHWYRRQLLVAVGLGVFGGVFALAFSAVTKWAVDAIFGEPTDEVWAGEWWWILVIAGGAVLVYALRKGMNVPEEVPGAVALAKAAEVDPKLAPRLVVISAVSLIVGASLGPSFAIVVAGGGVGAWVVSRVEDVEPEAEHQYTLTGMTGALGAVFTSPLFATVLGNELSPTKKEAYVAAFIPQFLAATVGYVIFFSVTDETMLGAFSVPGYEFELGHLPLGVVLGVFAAITLLVHATIGNAVRRLVAIVQVPWLSAAAGGGLIGFMAFALPLTAAGGSSQLTYTADSVATLGIGLLAAVLIGKMIAMTLSQEVGFLGGTVFPILFIGGTAGALVHAIFPDIPAPLAMAAMIAAVPGATIAAPVSFILIGFAGVALGPVGVAPVGIAVITSYLAISTVRFFKEQQDAM